VGNIVALDTDLMALMNLTWNGLWVKEKY